MIVGLSLGVLLGFSAMSVDLGLLRLASTQLQAGVDAATVSGAAELDGTLAGIARAKARAVEVAGLNEVIGTPLDVALSEVEVGTYNSNTGVFGAWDNSSATTKFVNAIRIDHAPPQVGSVLGAVAFGIAGYDIEARSMAIRPVAGGVAKTTKCFLPIAVPDCWVSDTPPGTNPLPMKFTFTPSTTDAIAWGDPDGNPNSSDVRDQLNGQCSHDEIAVGDPIYVNEGSHTTALQTIGDILNGTGAATPSTWNTTLYGPMPLRTGLPHTANFITASDVSIANWGHTLEGPVALVDAGSVCSSSMSFTGTLTMTGIAWAVLYDVKSSGSGKNVYMQLDLVNEHDIWGEVDTSAHGNVLATGTPTLVSW